MARRPALPVQPAGLAAVTVLDGVVAVMLGAHGLNQGGYLRPFAPAPSLPQHETPQTELVWEGADVSSSHAVDEQVNADPESSLYAFSGGVDVNPVEAFEAEPYYYEGGEEESGGGVEEGKEMEEGEEMEETEADGTGQGRRMHFRRYRKGSKLWQRRFSRGQYISRLVGTHQRSHYVKRYATAVADTVAKTAAASQPKPGSTG